MKYGESHHENISNGQKEKRITPNKLKYSSLYLEGHTTQGLEDGRGPIKPANTQLSNEENDPSLMAS